MFRNFLRRRSPRTRADIAPDEIFLDASNLPSFNTHQFEGRLEKPLARWNMIAIPIFFFAVTILFSVRLFSLQVVRGESYRSVSEENRLHHTLIFGERGVINDRRGIPLVSNAPGGDSFVTRVYTDDPGFGHVLGYISYPSKDSSGFYYEEDFIGRDGIERALDGVLRGVNGLKIIETNALFEIQSESVIRTPRPGTSVNLSVDARIQSAFYRAIVEGATEGRFTGGAGVIMDVETGELIAMTSFPEYDPNVMTNQNTVEKVAEYQNSPAMPFLNRATAGVYAPGSIVKPFMALASLSEGIVTPQTIIVSEGFIAIPHPYIPGEKTIFKDWKAHGPVDMRDAIAVSSDVYFYEIGGGFGSLRGLGIERIEKYMRLFGFGAETGIALLSEETGVVPNPEWKIRNFDGEPWRIGNTYHTAIGQYGFQVTPLQAARAIAAIANGGRLVTPQIIKPIEGQKPEVVTTLKLPDLFFEVVREGMRQAVTGGTAKGLFVPYATLAAKTGTAEVGIAKKNVHAWLIGFFPLEMPRYAFAIVLENGPEGSPRGGVSVARSLFDWMAVYTPEYFSPRTPVER